MDNLNYTTAEQLAKHLGKHKNTIVRWESQGKLPKAIVGKPADYSIGRVRYWNQTVEELAKHLGMDETSKQLAAMRDEIAQMQQMIADMRD